MTGARRDLGATNALSRLLQHQLHGVTDQIDTFAGAERVEQLGRTD
jgi:hypothetical protein